METRQEYLTVQPGGTSYFWMKTHSIGAGRHACADNLPEAAEVVGQAM